MIFIYLAASATVRPEYNDAVVKTSAPKMKKTGLNLSHSSTAEVYESLH